MLQGNDYYSPSFKAASFLGQSKKEIDIEQRSHELQEASADYLRGKINEDTLEEIEKSLATDYEEAAYNSASPTRSLWSGLLSLIKFW